MKSISLYFIFLATLLISTEAPGQQFRFSVGCVQNYTVSGTLNAPKGYVAGNTITTTHVVESGSDNRVEYHADNEIIFSVGFHAKAGSQVIADGKGCAGGYH